MRILTVFLLVLLLPGCALFPSKTAELSYSKASLAPLYDVKSWIFVGRLALIAKNEGWSLDLDWRHALELDEIELSGPLGQGVTKIRFAEGVASIDRGKGEISSSSDPEQFISQLAGVYVPVYSLRYWVTGLPNPKLPYSDFDNGFEQSGWRVEYTQLQPVGDLFMPRKIVVTKEQVKLKLIIDKWHLEG